MWMVFIFCLFLAGCGFGQIATVAKEAKDELFCVSGLAKLQYTPEQICERCVMTDYQDDYCKGGKYAVQ